MSHRHSEIEYKFSAEHVDDQHFITTLKTFGPESHIHITSPDEYYELGGIAVRHRLPSGAGPGELTVKRRKSETSITDRFEVDLFFNEETTAEDVRKFLLLSGWKHTLTIWKEANIFTFGHKTSVVFYKCWATTPTHTEEKKFIEIEVGKGTNTSRFRDMERLDVMSHMIKKALHLGEAIELSLYEIFSGKRYLVHNDGERKDT